MAVARVKDRARRKRKGKLNKGSHFSGSNLNSIFLMFNLEFLCS